MLDYPDLYVLRHGETIWNQEGKFQGRQDSPLTEKGKGQALRQRVLLSMIKNQPKKIYTSPIERAVQTARIVVGAGKNLVIDDRLQEIDFGEWEGLTRQDIKSLIDYSFDSGSWHFQSPGGESFEGILDRIQSFLNDLEEPAIIVTHGITSIVLRGLYMQLNKPDMLSLPKDQGCIFKLSKGKETIFL